MSKITVILKTGARRIFDRSRGGGSYVNTVRYEGQFAVVTDVWKTETAFPADEITEIISEPFGGQ